MGKRVILTLMPGSFEEGFPVILRIREDGATAETGIQVLGKLPPAPNILELFKQWQSAYRQMVMPHSRIKAKPVQVTNFSCRELSSQLAERLNDWLNSGSREWQKIRDRLQQNLNETDEIQVIIETDDLRLRQLPWHLWDLFSEHYTLAEIALSAPEYQPPRCRTAILTDKVKILAILGNSTGIDVQKDRAILEHLPDAETTFLVEPQRQELNNQLWDQKWKVLFFAGHSSSQVEGKTGQIYINQTDSLSLAELKNALRRAIEQGLQLAIFNSCDGLGLAQSLGDLHIPQVIVMREPVPDLVAQEFLRHFLVTFSGGQSLYASVREARERLQKLEGEYPCATWLPVICQNPAQVPTTWQEWCGVIEPNPATGFAQQENRQILPSSRPLRGVFLGSGQDIASKPYSPSVSTSTNRLTPIIGLVIAALVSGGALNAYLQWQSDRVSIPNRDVYRKTSSTIDPVPHARTSDVFHSNENRYNSSPISDSKTPLPRTPERSPTSDSKITNPRTTERSSTASATKTNPRTPERSPTASATKTNPRTPEPSPTSDSKTPLPATPERSPTASATKTNPRTPERSPTASATKTNPRTPERSPTSDSKTPLPATPEPSPTSDSKTPLPATPEPSPTSDSKTPLPATPERSPTSESQTPLPTPEPSPTGESKTPLPTPERSPTSDSQTPLPTPDSSL